MDEFVYRQNLLIYTGFPVETWLVIYVMEGFLWQVKSNQQRNSGNRSG